MSKIHLILKFTFLLFLLLFFQNVPEKSMKRQSTNPIESYFGKLPKQNLESSLLEPQPSTSSCLDTSVRPHNPKAAAQPTNDVSSNTSEASKDIEMLIGPTTSQDQRPGTNGSSSVTSIPDSSNPLSTFDIGNYVGKPVDRFTKFGLLQNHWQPPKNYSFPFSIHKKGGKEVKRYLSRNHLESKPWLVLSEAQKGLYCKYCALFSQEYSGHNKGVHLQSFVKKPVTSFAKLLGKEGFIENHERNVYHQNSVEVGKNFVKAYLSPEEAVINKLNTQRLQQISENRERLRPIIETIIFLGRQNIPLRGHRDDGQLLESEPALTNEGNFRELLRFRVVSGDNVLKKHLENTSSRATYVGKNTQNQLIECCGEEIKTELISRVKNAGCYSIIFDETTDLSHTSQLSLTVRYIWNGLLREDFFGFIDAHESLIDFLGDKNTEPKISGERLGKIVLKLIKEVSLDVKECVGVGTDSCSVMSSDVKGAVSEILKEAVHAVRCPCLNHGLNNSLSKSNNVQSVRNLVGTIKSVVEFFSASAKRNTILQSALRERNEDLEEFKGTKLSSLCETRWVERHDSVIKFQEALPYIVNALGSISGWSEINTSSKANALKKVLCDVNFITSLLSLIDVLKQTLPLSKMLQSPSLDLKKASDVIIDTISILESKRKECDTVFAKIFVEVRNLCTDLDVEIKMPRLAGVQRHRPNYATSDPEDFFKKSIYIPLLDNIVIDLKSRFPKDTVECFGLQLLIPTSILRESDPPHQSDSDSIKDKLCALTDKFSPILGLKTSLVQVQAEFDLWKTKWIREKQSGIKVPNTALDALEACDTDIFPTIHAFLKILSTLPVSVASAERSFSTLRRLKTWLRSTMSEERLSGLCLLHTHRDVEVDVNKVIDRFAKSGNRRLDFII